MSRLVPSPVEPPDRPDLYVVARFLDRLHRDEQVHTRSSLQRAVRLNYDLFRSYLALLEQKGFVETVEGQRRSPEVHLTEAGQVAWHDLVAWIRDILGEDHL